MLSKEVLVHMLSNGLDTESIEYSPAHTLLKALINPIAWIPGT